MGCVSAIFTDGYKILGSKTLPHFSFIMWNLVLRQRFGFFTQTRLTVCSYFVGPPLQPCHPPECWQNIFPLRIITCLLKNVAWWYCLGYCKHCELAYPEPFSVSFVFDVCFFLITLDSPLERHLLVCWCCAPCHLQPGSLCRFTDPSSPLPFPLHSQV